MKLSFLREHFTVLMIGIVLVTGAVLFVYQHVVPKTQTSVAPVMISATDTNVAAPSANQAPIVPSVLQAEWRANVSGILADYDQTRDARTARDRLLAVRVPADARDLDLALYLALNALTNSETDGAAKLAAARASLTASAPTATTTASSTR